MMAGRLSEHPRPVNHAAALRILRTEAQRLDPRERNRCRAPWVNTTAASLRQALPGFGSHTVTAQLDVFNVLNLLHASWGRLETPTVNVLSHIDQARLPNVGKPAFTFRPDLPRFSHDNTDSAYQLQLSLRYAF